MICNHNDDNNEAVRLVRLVSSFKSVLKTHFLETGFM